MLVIIEGPDGSGKSTLARDLVKLIEQRDPRHLVELQHAGPPTRHPLNEYLRPLTSYRPGEERHIILDRWHVGERVYPQVRGRPTQLDDQSWWSIDRYLRRLGAVVVQCVPPPLENELTLKARGECEHLAELPAVEKLFADAYAACHLPPYTYAWRDGDLEAIVENATFHEREVAGLKSFVTYLGAPRPTVLLLGDVRHNMSKSGPVDNPWDPAFLPFRATSGHYLIGALDDADLAWSGVGLANACDVDDPVALWHVLGQPPVVALGRRAERRLRGTPVPFRTVSHPQYMRRFHHRQRAEYGALIKQAIELQGDSSCLTSSPVEPVPTFTIRF